MNLFAQFAQVAEQWRPAVIPANETFAGNYSVSSHGNVRRETSGPHTQAGKILKPVKDSDGYSVVSLSYKGAQKVFKIHRLVALAFLPNPEGKQQVNHKNGIVSDNDLCNLEWSTGSENNKHAYDVLGRTPRRGELHWASKLIEADVIEMRRIWNAGGTTQAALAVRWGIAKSQVWRIVNGLRWAHLA